MSERRRSLRTTIACQKIDNLFAQKYKNQELAQKIPPSIFQKIRHLEFVSCGMISQLPQFYPSKNLDDEFQGALLATSYQLEWQADLIIDEEKSYSIVDEEVPEMLEEMAEMDKDRTHYQADLAKRRKKYKSIWEDPYFLQKLNEFIMGKPRSGKIISQTEELFQL